MRKTVLLCYPRSGSTFTTEIIKFLNYHSTLLDLKGEDKKLMEPPFNLSAPTAESAHRSGLFDAKFIKLHGQNTEWRDVLNLWISDEDTLLILLLRHPQEAYASHNSNRPVQHSLSHPPWSWCSRTATTQQFPQTTIDDDYFYENLKTYHTYGGPKIVMYYEDLVQDPAKYVRDLCVLYDISPETGELFMRDYEQHFKECREFYNGPHGYGTTRTDGRSIKTLAKSTDFWEHFFKKCEEFNVGEAKSLCARYYEEKTSSMGL
jgi:hypothetical protein